ncbi:adenosine deaminase [Actinotalea sp.]|uniref:adenosine deaminase n=1 Tax=Actinotalea sp. TaxID=1872145 RepID=UPI0035633545
MTSADRPPRGLPTVVLHDHLDGGLRAQTLVELAGEIGHELPFTDPDRLATWYVEAASSGDLETYIRTFEHTLAVMQSAANLRRIAAEAVVDLAADGVVHAEQRYAPELHQRGGLSGQEVVDAVQEGIDEGVALAAAAGHPISVVQILTMMRNGEHGRQTAELVLANRDRGVGGADLAGPEAGYPVSAHKRALRILRQASMPVTIHAGEADGVGSIADALHLGGAIRIGHGARLVEDISFGEPTPDDPWGLDGAVLGRVARWVLDQQVPLELCPSSNLHTGVVDTVAHHPMTALLRLGFAVTVSPDNRLMSGTSQSRELGLLVEHAGWTHDDLRDVTVTAAWNAFLPHDARERLVEDVILPAYLLPSNGRHRA